jgi:electron transfer flavoprotein alpha/beta subunit
LVALVDYAEADDGGLNLRRQTDYGYDQVRARCPVLVTITNCEGNVPRIPKTRDVMKSYRKELTIWSMEELGVPTDDAVAEVVELSIPSKDINCEFVEGDSLEEKIDAFARRIGDVMSGLG